MTDQDRKDDDADDNYEDPAVYLEGPCTCNHPLNEENDTHTWTGCTVEGCPCERHLEE